MSGKREFGDYQTPEDFSVKVCKYLKEERKVNPSIIIEPTCGLGSFLKSSLIFENAEIVGVEINPQYCDECKRKIDNNRVTVINADYFSFDLKKIIRGNDKVLVVGNPPWVNNSTLSSLESRNLPKKINFKGLRGMEALTGASNFDICEYIILQILTDLRGSNATIALLCKTSVARNIFVEMKRTYINCKTFDIFEFNANKVFGINASACLMVIELTTDLLSVDACNVYSFDNPKEIKNSFGYKDGKLYSKIEKNIIDFSGECCFEWRQGVKHDCAKIMELTSQGVELFNGMKEKVEIETEYVFPLVKSSMFKRPIIDDFNKYVIVTQKKIKEDTFHIKSDAPKTWDYLNAHKEFFEKRKSSIYKNSPEFSMFGIGNYSYEKYKVGISGFYKKPFFSVLMTNDGKPVMTDDTSYFITMPTFDMAYTAMLILNSEKVQKFLMTIAFLDAKRPYTKKVLERIDFHKILRYICIEDLINTEIQLKLDKYFNKRMLENFKNLPEFTQGMLELE